MFNLINQHWDSILVVILFILFLLYLIKKGAKIQVNKMLLYLVTEAEKSFGGGTGTLKFAAVTSWLYEKLPAIVTILFTPKQIDELIEEAVKKMKEYLEKNDKAKILILPPEKALE